MAAYDPSEDICQQTIDTQRNPALKVFLFDKDDTLIHYSRDIKDKQANNTGIPNNPEQFKEIFQYIVRNPKTTKWIMISRGGGTMRTPQQPGTGNDESLDRFRQQVLCDGYIHGNANTGMNEKENFFCSLGNGYRSTIQSNFKDPRAIFISTEFFCDGKGGQIDPTFIIQQGVIIRNDDNKLCLKFQDVEYLIKESIVLEFPNGIVYRLNLENFFKNRSTHENGNNKIIQALYGIAGAGAAVITNEKMKGLGIELLAPGSAVTIEAKQTFGLDDEEACVEAWRAVGFNAAKADNQVAIERELKHIAEFIGDSLTNNYVISAIENKPGKFSIAFINWKNHSSERIFELDDTLDIIVNGVEKQVNLKEFMEQRKLEQNSPPVKVVRFNPAKSVVEFDTYTGPLVQHLGFGSFEELKVHNSNNNLNETKDLILNETNKFLVVSTDFKELATGVLEHEKGYKKRQVINFFKQVIVNNSFENDAIPFLRKVSGAYNLDEILVILAKARQEKLQSPEFFDNICKHIDQIYRFDPGVSKVLLEIKLNISNSSRSSRLGNVSSSSSASFLPNPLPTKEQKLNGIKDMLCTKLNDSREEKFHADIRAASGWAALEVVLAQHKREMLYSGRGFSFFEEIYGQIDDIYEQLPGTTLRSINAQIGILRESQNNPPPSPRNGK